jgi:hypothetical protein
MGATRVEIAPDRDSSVEIPHKFTTILNAITEVSVQIYPCPRDPQLAIELNRRDDLSTEGTEALPPMRCRVVKPARWAKGNLTGIVEGSSLSMVETGVRVAYRIGELCAPGDPVRDTKRFPASKESVDIRNAMGYEKISLLERSKGLDFERLCYSEPLEFR